MSAGSFRRRLREGMKALRCKEKPPCPLRRCSDRMQRLCKDLSEKVPSYGTVFSIVRRFGTADLGNARPRRHEGVQQHI